MASPLPDLGGSVAESTLKALSPTRSIFYTPVAVATVALCWVTGDVNSAIWWAPALLLLVAISALVHFAWSAKISLRGVAWADELRIARVIALCGAFITLVTALRAVSPSPFTTVVHVTTCALQIICFIVAAGSDTSQDDSPSRFNVIQLTLILSALLGGAAYSLSQYVDINVNTMAQIDESLRETVSQFEQWQHYDPQTAPEDIANSLASNAAERDAARVQARHYLVTAFCIYILWLAAGAAWFRGQPLRIFRRRTSATT